MGGPWHGDCTADHRKSPPTPLEEGETPSEDAPKGRKRGRRKSGSKEEERRASLGFEDRLWEAADLLRNNMDPAEYKHAVLGLLFLKYISDAFTERQQTLRRLICEDTTSDYYVAVPAQQKAEEHPDVGGSLPPARVRPTVTEYACSSVTMANSAGARAAGLA